MTKFLDGPAAGVILQIRRAPKLLRVVHDTGYAAAVCKKDRQEWDCLDQLSDVPRPGETIYAYILVSNDGMIHINSRDKRGRHTGGYFAMATYRLYEQQLDDATLRRTSAWQAWAQGQVDAMKGGAP